MQKKLTITIDEQIYKGLYKNIGARKISRFVEDLVKPHVIKPNLEAAYEQMSKDQVREEEALEWSEATLRDSIHETR
jgi:predicted CopG family antitoxin